MRNNADNSLLIVLLAIIVSSLTVVLGQARALHAGDEKEIQDSPSSLYLFNRDGEFQEIYGSSLIAGWHWNVARMAGVAPDLPSDCGAPEENGEKCSWSLRTIKYQPVTRHFYAVTASSGHGSGNKGSATYEFVGLFPDMREHVKFSISTSGTMTPLISISPNGERLVVLRDEKVANEANAGGTPQYTLVADSYRTDRLWNRFDKQSSVRSTWRYTSSQLQHLSVYGYFDASGTTAYDGVNRIAITKSSLTLETVDPLSPLSGEQQKTLATFTAKTAAQLAEEIRVLDSVEGKVLLGVANQAKDRQAIFTVDLAANTSTPVVMISGGIARLVHGRDEILLQTSSSGNTSSGNAMSNSFQVRDLRTGNLVFELNGGLPDLQVESYPLMCIPGDYLVYSVGSRVAALALKAGAHPTLIRTTLRLGEGSECTGVLGSQASKVDAEGGS
jgi:hypothetical protein